MGYVQGKAAQFEGDLVAPRLGLSRKLIKATLISYGEAAAAETTATLRNVPLADVYHARHGISRLTIASLLANAASTQCIDPLEQPPEPGLIQCYGPTRCLADGVLPWRRIGGVTVILATLPEKYAAQRKALQHCFGQVRMAITTDEHLTTTINQHFGASLVQAAETRTPAQQSCRNWNPRIAWTAGMVFLLTLSAAIFIYPQTTFVVLALWAILVLIGNTTLRAIAAFVAWRNPPPERASVIPARLPIISVLVPLYKETAIADHLLARLKDVDYPRELLDICVILEESDTTTRAALGRTSLPTWIRAISVPQGTIKTKPRALNFALNFARGSIIGVWDAEDAPAPDQLYQVAYGFACRGPEVACLQGVLDYYNASTNWLTRCFSVEYAGWFRIILPGFQKLGLVIPLGGTTLFFRRDALEALGAWDAHNVTEDADLGVRLARHGYRCELIASVTEEEANGHIWPWIKQRSRWLKGYAMTYGVHMRHPTRLWRDLGARRFWGFQLLFLGTLSQFVLAPVLWTFWLLPFGFTHPLSGLLPSYVFWALAGVFVMSELIGLAVAILGTRKAEKPWLAKWAVTLQLYFPLAALAAYKGLAELVTRPFFWDKTAHGVMLPAQWKKQTIRPLRQPAHPISNG